jgi:hypothetical protein
LIHLINEGEKYNFNRQLDLDMVLQDVDPEGSHVLSVELFNHSRDTIGDVNHHRCSGMMKIQNSMEPQRVWIDIAADTWEMLPVSADSNA